MLKDCVAIFYISSTKLTLSVCERSVNGSFSFRANEECEAYTFFDGEFYDVKAFEESVCALHKRLIVNSSVSEINTVYVGVPGEFTKTLTKKCRIRFGTVKKISKDDVLALYKNGLDEEDNEYTLSHRTASYFVVDNYKTHEPIGKKATSLSARIYYSLISNYFTSVVSGVFNKIGVKNVKYISQDYAEGTYLFPLQERDQTKLLINVSKTTTSLSIVYGNGLLFSSAFSVGSANVIAEYMEKYECDYEVAELLFNKLNLGLKDRGGALYLVSDRRYGDYTFPRNEVNEKAKEVLDLIAENCDNAISKCKLKIPSDIEIAFTGDGICHVKGATQYISMRLGVFPVVVSPSVPHYNKPSHTSWLSLIDTAISASKNKTFFA
ncbi:MAG: hypothetical protein IKL82_04610 [Clostridia bacterium]|nr:hypothetical protein [Clostridia bacterium]